MSKKLEECAKAKSQLKVTDWISSAEGSESEGTDNQYKRVLRKRRREPTGDPNTKTYPPPPPHKRQTNIKTPSPNPKPRMTSTPKPTQDPSTANMDNSEIALTPELELLEKKLNHTMVANMAAQFAPIQSAIDKILKSSNIIENQQRRIEDLTMENCKLKNEVIKLRGDVHDLKSRMNEVENKSLENNLIIHGIPDNENEYLNQLVDKLQRNFADTIDIYDDEVRLQRARGIHIARCKRIGQYQENRHRPIKVEFVYKWDADELYENRFYLSKGIYINREFNEQTESARKLLRPILKATKQYSEYRNGSRLDGDKLVINGRRYGKNNLHQLPDKLKPMKVSTKEKNDIIGFFGELCPFSNFHSAEFLLNGHIYHSSEQYIQHQKAIYCGDNAAAQDIMSCKTALQCKRASKNIENYDSDRWIKYAETECVKGLLAKFDQNPKLKTTLLNTRGKTLVECSWDTVWGTGCPLSQPDCLEAENWSSPGLLGSLLMTVREKLMSTELAHSPIAPHMTTDPQSINTKQSDTTTLRMETDPPATANAAKC